MAYLLPKDQRHIDRQEDQEQEQESSKPKQEHNVVELISGDSVKPAISEAHPQRSGTHLLEGFPAQAHSG